MSKYYIRNIYKMYNLNVCKTNCGSMAAFKKRRSWHMLVIYMSMGKCDAFCSCVFVLHRGRNSTLFVGIRNYEEL